MNGPVTKPEDLNAGLRLSQLQLTAALVNRGQSGKFYRSPEPAADCRGIEQFRCDGEKRTSHGRDTDITIGGTAALRGPRPLKLDVNAKTNLSLFQAFNRDLYSSGEITLQAAIRGQLSEPEVNGKLALQNASMNFASIPNGISNANGVILLNGTSAVIQNLTAQSGGGKLSADGFAALTGRRFSTACAQEPITCARATMARAW